MDGSGWIDRCVEAGKSDATILFLSKEDLIKAKRIAGRHQDLADIEEMERPDSS